MKIPKPVAFEWDSGNISKNWNKHKVHYKEIEEIFFNKPILIIEDKEHSEIEKRYVGYGKTNSYKKLTVIFTVRNKKIRIISARIQHKKERSLYEKKDK